MRTTITVMAFAGVLVGCGEDPRNDGLFGPGGQTSAGADNAASSGPAGPGSSGADDGSDDDPDAPTGSGGPSGGDSSGIKLDVGDGQSSSTAGDTNGPGCDKADFLFIIDNSGSMGGEQQNLIASFPGFISTIQQTLQAQDYHVMVVDTDPNGGGGTSTTCINGVCTCSPGPACCESVCQTHDSCNGVACDMLSQDDCDGTVGAGKVFREDGTQCIASDGPRFMDDTTADLATDFSCVAEVGTFGSGNETPMDSMLEAVSVPMNAAGACNEGFLRDDAILVVTFITDEEDDGKSAGNPASWKQELVAAKGGNEDAVVVLGLFGDHDQAGGTCSGDEAEPAPRLRAFTESFDERGFAGSVCAPDYSVFFAEAVQIIDLACDELVPQG